MRNSFPRPAVRVYLKKIYSSKFIKTFRYFYDGILWDLFCCLKKTKHSNYVYEMYLYPSLQLSVVVICRRL